MFIPLLEMTNDPEKTSKENNTLSNIFKEFSIELNLTEILIFIVLIFVFKGGIKFFGQSYQVSLYQTFIKDIRISLVENFSTLKFEKYLKSDKGQLQNTFTIEINRITSACRNYLKLIEALALIGTYVGLAYFTNPKFTLLVVIFSLGTSFVYNHLNKLIKNHSRRLVTNNSFFQGELIQLVSLFKYLLASGTIFKFSQKVNQSIIDVEKTNKKIGILNAIALSIREPIMIIILTLVILIHIELLDGSLDLILISILFFYRALQAVMQFQTNLNQFISLTGSIDNVISTHSFLVKHRNIDGDISVNSFNNKIELENISFTFKENTIFKDLSLSLEKGHIIALVGESGTGKTTLVNIISGLYNVNLGNIKIDNINYENICLNSFRKLTGYVSQEFIIFNDTLYNNVTLWDDDSPENIEKFKIALRKASLLDTRFLNDIYMELGSNGLNLSGGQRQRIAIAREFYKNPEILFMDEATSALDSKTEKNIFLNLDELKKDKTIIIITHRLSTIKEADKIVFLKKDNNNSFGSYNELVKTDEDFKRMIELQKSED